MWFVLRLDFPSISALFHASKTSTGLSFSPSCSNQSCSYVHFYSNYFFGRNVRCKEYKIDSYRFSSIGNKREIGRVSNEKGRHIVFLSRFWRHVLYEKSWITFSLKKNFIGSTMFYQVRKSVEFDECPSLEMFESRSPTMQTNLKHWR